MQEEGNIREENEGLQGGPRKTTKTKKITKTKKTRAMMRRMKYLLKACHVEPGGTALRESCL